MRKKIFLFIGLVIISTIGFKLYQEFLPPSIQFGGVKKFGHLTIGGNMPSGPGDATFAPWKIIPSSTFYIIFANDEGLCVFEDCIPEGKIVEAQGGWLQGEVSIGQTEVQTDFGLDTNQIVKSIVVVGNKDAKIVGIYPNKRSKDILSIIQFHGDIIDLKQFQ